VRKVTVEVVRPPNAASSGARVVRLDGRPLLLDAVELGGRAELLPPLPLNTNTFMLDTDVTDDDLPLPWRYYEKDVEGARSAGHRRSPCAGAEPPCPHSAPGPRRPCVARAPRDRVRTISGERFPRSAV
jgi:hypothetical protein